MDAGPKSVIYMTALRNEIIIGAPMERIWATLTNIEVDKALTYELTACSFPIQGLSHTYSFEQALSPIMNFFMPDKITVLCHTAKN